MLFQVISKDSYLGCHFHISWIRHPMCYDGRLKGNNWTVITESLGHFLVDDKVARVEALLTRNGLGSAD